MQLFLINFLTRRGYTNIKTRITKNKDKLFIGDLLSTQTTNDEPDISVALNNTYSGDFAAIYDKLNIPQDINDFIKELKDDGIIQLEEHGAPAECFVKNLYNICSIISNLCPKKRHDEKPGLEELEAFKASIAFNKTAYHDYKNTKDTYRLNSEDFVILHTSKIGPKDIADYFSTLNNMKDSYKKTFPESSDPSLSSFMRSGVFRRDLESIINFMTRNSKSMRRFAKDAAANSGNPKLNEIITHNAQGKLIFKSNIDWTKGEIPKKNSAAPSPSVREPSSKKPRTTYSGTLRQ